VVERVPRDNKVKRESYGGQWQTVYASLIMVLLVFFVTLAAHSTLGVSRLTQMRETALGKHKGGGPSEVEVLARRLPGPDGGIFVEKTDGGVRIRLARGVVFAPGLVEPLPGARPLVRELARQALSNRYRVHVTTAAECRSGEGGNPRPDWETAAARAEFLWSLFVREGGVSPAMVTAGAQGSPCPGDAAGGEIMVLLTT